VLPSLFDGPTQALGAFYGRLSAPIGKAKVVTARARKITATSVATLSATFAFLKSMPLATHSNSRRSVTDSRHLQFRHCVPVKVGRWICARRFGPGIRRR
jgi:hypothetical protein